MGSENIMKRAQSLFGAKGEPEKIWKNVRLELSPNKCIVSVHRRITFGKGCIRAGGS